MKKRIISLFVGFIFIFGVSFVVFASESKEYGDILYCYREYQVDTSNVYVRATVYDKNTNALPYSKVRVVISELSNPDPYVQVYIYDTGIGYRTTGIIGIDALTIERIELTISLDGQTVHEKINIQIFR